MSSNYDHYPSLELSNDDEQCVEGWTATVKRIGEALPRNPERASILTVECYAGAHEAEIIEALESLCPAEIIHSGDAFLSTDQIERRINPYNGGDDPVFGRMCSLTMTDFMDSEKVEVLRQRAIQRSEGLVIVVGCGATLIHEGDVLVYADLARWELQQRMRRDEISNLGIDNKDDPWSLQYKRAYFIDWRVCDRLKRDLIPSWNFVLDTNEPGKPRLATGSSVRSALEQACQRPFRVVPFFDPAPWGGQWMKQRIGLDPEPANYGWGFDCVPEENSLLLQFGDIRMEIPSINLVFHQPRALLGESVHARFGDEFPIRFDFLDTVDGGNLSFQVHPLTEYIKKHFGMSYTQDESYYVLDAKEGAKVYLGTKDETKPTEMTAALKSAQRGDSPFDADRYVKAWPAKKHDHFLIPAGTCHCSGSDAMILEISATPYIFTFKLWDWQRLGLDGKPRPINIERGLKNIQWDRTSSWVKENLVNQFEAIAQGPGWREERTGLHELEFIETRRHWFTDTVEHNTNGGVNVLNLVEGREAIVESPTNTFTPFIVHYAETFIVPASVGSYTVRPHGESIGQECATLKAYVRT